jgi:hypothetical protein
MQKIKVVESPYAGGFEDEVNKLLANGYSILSTNCGRIGKADNSIKSFYNAVLITNNELHEHNK